MDTQEESNETKKLVAKAGVQQHKYSFQTLLGLAAAFGCVFLYTTAATCVQLLERRIPDFELNAIRSFVTLLCCSLYLTLRLKLPRIERSHFGPIFLYMGLVFVNRICTYLSVSLVPIAAACSLQYATTVTTSLILFPMTGLEKLSMKKVLMAALCVSGVFLVTQPTFRADNNSVKLDNLNSTGNGMSSLGKELPDICKQEQLLSNSTVWGKVRVFVACIDPSTTTGQIVGYLAAFITGIFFTLLNFVVKKFSCITENIAKTLFWIFVCHTCLSLILMTLFETPVLPSNWFDTIMILSHSFACPGLFALYIYGPKYISGITFAIIVTTDVVFLLLSQYTVLSSILPGHRNWMEVAGVVLVLLGCSMSSILEMINSKR